MPWLLNANLFQVLSASRLHCPTCASAAAMVLSNIEMESLGVKVFAAWRRYSQLRDWRGAAAAGSVSSTWSRRPPPLSVQYLVPDNEETLKRVNEILIDMVEHFTDRDFIGRQLPGYQVIKCRVWCVKKDT